jgi:hypothetical protein
MEILLETPSVPIKLILDETVKSSLEVFEPPLQD